MKKVFILFSLLATLVSCKNYEKSKQLGSSDTQVKEDVNSNKPASTLLSTDSKVKPIVVESGIYQDKDSLYHLKYILEVGKTYSFNSKEINKQTVSFRDKNQTMSQESHDPISFTVLNSKDNKYTLQVKMGGKKVITKADGQQFTFDTNSKIPSDPNQAQMWKIYKAISEVAFTMEMDIYGNVSNINGMDAIYTKAKSSLSKDLKGKELDEFVNAFKQGLNPQSFKAQFEGSMMRFPAKGLKIGEKWNNDPSRKADGYNQLVKVSENITEIKVQGNIPSKSDSKVVEGVTYKISMKGNQNGKISIDNKSGWISKAHFNVSVTETKLATKGDESEKVIQKTENNTYIN